MQVAIVAGLLFQKVCQADTVFKEALKLARREFLGCETNFGKGPPEAISRSRIIRTDLR